MFYIRHSLCSIPPHKSAHICIRATRMGPLPAWALLAVFTFSKWRLTCHSSTSLSKDPQTPHRHEPTPVSHSHKSQVPSWNCFGCPSRLTPLEYMVDTSWTQSQREPLEDAHLGHRLLMHHFLLHNRPRWQAGTHSLIMFIVTTPTSLSEMLGS